MRVRTQAPIDFDITIWTYSKTPESVREFAESAREFAESAREFGESAREFAESARELQTKQEREFELPSILIEVWGNIDLHYPREREICLEYNYVVDSGLTEKWEFQFSRALVLFGSCIGSKWPFRSLVCSLFQTFRQWGKARRIGQRRREHIQRAKSKRRENGRTDLSPVSPRFFLLLLFLFLFCFFARELSQLAHFLAVWRIRTGYLMYKKVKFF